MRNGRRLLVVVAMVGLLPVGGGAPSAAAPARADGGPVRLTVEVGWSTGAEPAGAAELEVSEGRVVDAVAWPDGPAPGRVDEKVWRLGEPSRGRVRARVELPVTASLVVRAGGQALRFPLTSLLEGPQKTPAGGAVEVSVERLPWDTVTVDLGGDPPPEPEAKAAAAAKHDGVVAPGASVPVTVGFNVLTAEPTAVGLRCVAELRPFRGGEPVWRQQVQEVLATNAPTPTSFALAVEAPKVEGTYVLELKASWEQVAGHEGVTRIGRWIRRGKRGVVGGSGSTTRRVTFTVQGPTEPGRAVAGPEKDRVVDAVDLARPRGARPTAAGRAPAGGASWPVPEGALAEPSARDRLRGWIARGAAEVATLGAADAQGLAWSALGLKVARPGVPHRLTLTVTGGHPAAVGVALVGPGPRPRVLLDACASGPPILPDVPPTTFSWLVWPDSTDPVLVLVNRGTAAVQLGAVALTELTDLPAGPPVTEPAGTSTRGLAVALTGPGALERFAAGSPASPGLADPLAAARHLAGYLNHCGASAVLLSDALADRARRRALEGQAAEDPTGPDRLAATLRALARRDLAAWVELGLDGPLPGLPDPGSPEALTRGLVRLDRQGRPDGARPVYQPLHPDVAAALKRAVTEAAAAHRGHGKIAGVVVRLGRGPTLPGAPDTGFDDATFARFVPEAFDAETVRTVPGVDPADPERFAARAKFLAGSGRMPWLTWRSKRVAALYGELAEAATAQGVALAVVTPGLGGGPAAAEARRADVAGLAPSLAWRAVGLDLNSWPTGPHAPLVLRGVGLSPDELAHDLATSPELDAQVAGRPERGLLLDVDAEPAEAPALTAMPLDSGPPGDEPLGHALAALDARWVMLGATAAAGHEDRLRRFAPVFRGLPAPAGPTPAETPALPYGVAVRAYPAAGATFLGLANDTPYPVRLEAVLEAPAGATFDDLGRNARLRPGADAAGRHLVLDLLPFGTAAVKVGAPGVAVRAVTPYPSEAVLTTLQARHDEVAGRLSRLTRAVGPRDRGGPPNSGLEPEERPATLSVPAAPKPPEGWQAGAPNGASGYTLTLDPKDPHSGRTSLRLETAAPPAWAVSDPFAPGPYPALVVRAWLRADRPDTRVRLWLEGESQGKPWRRVSELTAAPGWAERAVRASDAPPAGLDPLRLRFELVTPGTLWVDDVSVAGAGLSDPEKRNARNALVAAIQAYREKRYADFARLAGSRWARLTAEPPAPVSPAPPTATADGAATERNGLIRTGDATPLPRPSRLR